ncbi:MAG: SH3 domain-containing protein [Treponemataceae bacterium]
MRNISILFVLFVLNLTTVALEPSTIETNPKRLYTFLEIDQKDQLFTDGPGEHPVRPIFEGELGVSFFMKDQTVRRYSYSLEKVKKIHYANLEDYNWTVTTTANSRFTLKAGTVFSIARIESDYLSHTKKVPLKDPFFIALIDNLVLYKDNNKSTIAYYSVAINVDGTFTERNHAETLELAESGLSGLMIKDGYLNYKGIRLDSRVEQFDDDGNQYSGGLVRCFDSQYGILRPEEFKYFSYFFDPEGNLFVLDYTKDADQHPVFYYAGRDWGYRENSKKAVTTEGGLRIRLRASTDAFVIDTMKENQNVTILKTGKTETIGGISAPWYRIKTTDGTIGWSFGGYIRVRE